MREKLERKANIQQKLPSFGMIRLYLECNIELLCIKWYV